MQYGKVLPFYLSCFLFVNVSFAQEEDESCVIPEDKKIQKVIKKAEDPKLELGDRFEYYTTAIDMAPDNAYVHFIFANFQYQQALRVHDKFDQGLVNFDQLKRSYEAAAIEYKRCIEACKDFHSDAYYKAGLIYHLIGDKGQASKYFKGFVEFDSKDPSKYNDEYAKNKKDVQEVLPEMEFFDTFYENKVPYDPVKVKNVSSGDMDEYLPMISPDNELLFYTRKGKFDQSDITGVVEMFTVSQRPSVKNEFDKGDPLRAPFNTDAFANYGGISLSLDNKEMFICACREVSYQEHVNCDIYVTRFERSGDGGNDFTWTPLENLGPNVNTKTGWEAQPTLSADGNTLYFATWREGSQLTDIYYSTRGADGKWTKAKPIPGKINTEGHDKAPFLHQDSETMYFTSQCSPTRLGAGGMDIFYTRFENGEWTEPKNLGYPINTEKNEVGMIVSTDGHLAYIASGHAQSYDIYYFELYKEARPKKVQFYKGEIKTTNGEPVEDATVEITYKESGESVQFKVNGDDGKFAAVVKAEDPQDIMITTKKVGNSFDSKLVKKEAMEEEDLTFTKGLEMTVDKLDVGTSFTIDDILYPTSSYALSEDAKFILDEFVKFMKENPTIKVSIQGHTDNRGNATENKTLSQNRAKGVMDYIISKGVDKSRLKSEGFGQEKPKFPNDTEANRAKNRRTEIMITAI